MPNPIDSAGADIQSQLQHAVVAVDLPCRRCDYDLKGLAGDRNCPECGLPVADTIESVVDPHASRLPRLRNPRLVGNGLVWLVLCGLVATVALVVHPMLIRVGPQAETAEHLLLASGLAMLLGLWSVLAFKPPRGREPDIAVWRDIWFITAGLALWAVMCAGLWGRSVSLSAGRPGAAWGDPPTVLLRLGLAPAAILVLLGVGGVLVTIGRRSLAYRRSNRARQTIPPMVWAMIGAAAGIVLRGAAAIWPLRDWTIGTEGPPIHVMTVVGTIGLTLLGVCAVMGSIGLVYMLANAGWIRSALCRPPPHLEQLVLPALPPDTRVPGEDDDEEQDELE